MNIEQKKRQLLYRSWHRGCKETDILLGGFARSKLRDMNESQLQRYEEILNASDVDIYKWLIKTEAIPTNYDRLIVEQIINFNENKHSSNGTAI